jgi:hypothetical protein
VRGERSPVCVIDAKHAGNMSRLLNHNCSPNVKVGACSWPHCEQSGPATIRTAASCCAICLIHRPACQLDCCTVQAVEVRQRHGYARILIFALRDIRRGESLELDYIPNVSSVLVTN